MTANGNDRGHRLALILQALDDCETEFARCRFEYRERKEKLLSEMSALKHSIITGQEDLPLEGN